MTESLTRALQSVKENFLECSICMEQYSDPRILSCVHSFCFKCIKQYVGTNRIIKCPMCNQGMLIPFNGISGLKSNFFIQGLIDQFRAINPVGRIQSPNIISEVCTSCDSGLHTKALCDGCETSICEHCIELHEQIVVLKRHKITLFAEIIQFKIDQHMKDIQQKLSAMEDRSLDVKVLQLALKVEAIQKEEAETLKKIVQRKDVFIAYVNVYVKKLKDDVIKNTKQRMGNIGEVIQSYQSKLNALTAFKEEHQMLQEIEFENKSTACERLLQQLKQFEHNYLSVPVENIPTGAEKKSFVDSVSGHDEYRSCCRRFVGFLKPFNSRDRRSVETRPYHMDASMENYAIECAQAAIDTYGEYPLSEETYANISFCIRNKFTERYSGNKWSVVASGRNDTNCAIIGNLSTVNIDDYEILFLEHV